MSSTIAAAPTVGFETQERETASSELPLRGELPPWLAGSLLRTGPAKWEVGERRMRHWFDGLAMLHGFSFAGGRVTYTSRFLESRAYRAARERGRIAYGEFATDPCRALFRRIQSAFSPAAVTDNANVNIARLGERFIAMTETPMPVEFDRRTLAAAGVAFTAPGQISTAHPHRDRAGGAMLNYAAKLGPRSSYRFFAVDANGAAPRVIASLGVREPAYMHSFGLTERWFVLAEFPLVVNPTRMVLAGRPYIENYRWKPELGTRFTLVDRASGKATRGFETDTCFCFHHVNAYEQDGEVVVDLCSYPDAGIIEDLYLERLRAGKPVTPPELTRFRLSLADRGVRRERLSEGGNLELPRINYGRCNERPYRYVWGNAGGPASFIDRIVKVDVETRTAQAWSEDGSYPGEPVFVVRPDAEAEDDGVLLSVVLDAARESSFLLVLDADDLSELARAEVPERIPFGFHGTFAR